MKIIIGKNPQESDAIQILTKDGEDITSAFYITSLSLDLRPENGRTKVTMECLVESVELLDVVADVTIVGRDFA
tara:strand:- start:15169 stop:15390 length:222 start_codon:yes stop_codon:yes gene_type:complete